VALEADHVILDAERAAYEADHVILDAERAAYEADHVILDAERAAYEADRVILDAELAAPDATPAIFAPIPHIDPATVNLSPEVTPVNIVPEIEAPAIDLVAAVELPTYESWTMDSTVADIELWLALPLELRTTWPRLDWFLVDRPQIVLPNPLPAASAAAAEFEAPLEPVLAAPRKKKKVPKTPRPVEDEWGMFDPEQCGLAAVIAKLDLGETTVTKKPRRNRHRAK
jgi:hypothetical protein